MGASGLRAAPPPLPPCRLGSEEVCARHVGALMELVAAAAAADGACAEGPAEGPLQRQLVTLVARLLRAAAHSGPLHAFAAELRAQARTPESTNDVQGLGRLLLPHASCTPSPLGAGRRHARLPVPPWPASSGPLRQRGLRLGYFCQV